MSFSKTTSSPPVLEIAFPYFLEALHKNPQKTSRMAHCHHPGDLGQGLMWIVVAVL